MSVPDHAERDYEREEEFEITVQAMTEDDRDSLREQIALTLARMDDVIGVHIDGRTWFGLSGDDER